MLSGRPISRAMQVAQKRLDLPTLPGLEILDPVDPNKKVNFTAEQLSRLSELLEIKLQEFNVKAKVVEAQPGPVVTRFKLDLAPGVKRLKSPIFHVTWRVQCLWLLFVWWKLFRVNRISGLKSQIVHVKWYVLLSC